MNIIPVLRVFDYAKIIEFYVDWLGAKIEWEHKPEGSPFYMQISIRGLRINLSQHHGECSPGALVLIEDFENLTDYHKTLTDKKYTFMKPGLQQVEWDPGTITLRVIDPFYNTIEFSEKPVNTHKNEVN
jgi:catechol 2,3-dioxygenase-like lactoylglutathione lyase family enzyme